MNGYDFDKTIFKGNSVKRFSDYCFLRLPYLWPLLIVYFFAAILYLMRIITKDKFLRVLEFFVVLVPNREKWVARFWDKNIKRVKQWYLAQKRPDDLIISASPFYLIQPICARLGVRCIASTVTKRGLVAGDHCYGQHKVTAYRTVLGDTPLATFYSDHMSDVPMFRLAAEGYLVDGDEITLIYKDGHPVER